MEVVKGNKSVYTGCDKSLADGYEKVMAYFHEMHRQSIEILNGISDSDLSRLVRTLDGKEITLGNFLRALIIHEVHHRGALCIYINLLGISSPPVIGLTEEQVIKLSKK